MRVLITGAAGRLGHTVSVELAARGHEIIAADRVRTTAPGMTARVVDLTDASAVTALLRESRPDAVVHLAAIAVPFSAPEDTILLTNTALCYTVLAAAAKAGVSRVLTASSPTVIGYGSASWHASALPIDEQHPVAPTNAYALSKVGVEEQVQMFARTHSGVFGAFRPCYVVAPEEWLGAVTQQGHTILERMMDPTLAAVSLFNYVDARDAADFVDRWLGAAAENLTGESFFVGAADALAARPVSELWRTYAPALGEIADELVGDAPVFSISKAERLLGWKPRYSWRTEMPADDLTKVLSITEVENAS